jgi:hypothetical protein
MVTKVVKKQAGVAHVIPFAPIKKNYQMKGCPTLTFALSNVAFLLLNVSSYQENGLPFISLLIMW